MPDKYQGAPAQTHYRRSRPRNVTGQVVSVQLHWRAKNVIILARSCLDGSSLVGELWATAVGEMSISRMRQVAKINLGS